MNKLFWRRCLIAVFCTVIVGVMYCWDLTDLRAELLTKQEEGRGFKQQFDLLLYQETAVESDIAQLSEIKKSLAEWQEKLIRENDLPQLLRQIIVTGKANHLQIKIFPPGEEVQENQYLKVPIKLMVIGDYFATANFIYQITNLPWFVVVSDFVIAKTQQLGAAAKMTTSMELDIYHVQK